MKMKAAFLSIALGLWLAVSPLTFSSKLDITGVSDIICGVLIVILGILSLAPQRLWSGWGIAIVGFWLQFAPLVFWAPSSWEYLNNTLVGALAIILAFIISSNEPKGSDEEMPLGWSCAPSGWTYRIPTVLLAMVCWFCSRYMAAYQLGYIDHIWDPFFHDGTLSVITSKVSKDFPVSDAGLGAFSYTLEFLLGWQGSTRRFATMPWLVLVFAFLVIPCSVVSICLIILQPVVVGAWCTWCLVTAAVMLVMIIFTAGEFAAALELMYDAKKRKDSLWQVFWKGERVEPGLVQHVSKRKLKKRCGMGITFPWNLIVSILVGIFLMMTPSLLGLKGIFAMSSYIIGPLVVSISVMALSEVLRAVRFMNVLLGLALIASLFFADAYQTIGVWHHVLLGLLIIILAKNKGKITQRYGSWEKLIF